MEKYLDKAVDILIQYGPRLLGALIILIGGSWLIRLIVGIMGKFLDKGRIDLSLRSFLKQALSLILKIILLVTAASALGIPTTSFIAIISAIGLAVGLAVKDNLANLAGGIIILLFRPFSVGNYIETGKVSGTVKEIRLIYTYLNTADNRLVLIPNGELANSTITNFSVEQDRRLDLTFAVSYREEIPKVKEILTRIVHEHPLIYKDREPLIRVSQHGEDALLFLVLAWCKNDDFQNVTFDLMEQVKMAFDNNGIVIPHGMRDGFFLCPYREEQRQ